MEKNIIINGKTYSIRIPGMWHGECGGHLFWWIIIFDDIPAPIYHCTRDGRIDVSLVDGRRITGIHTMPETMPSARAMLDYVSEHVEELITPIL